MALMQSRLSLLLVPQDARTKVTIITITINLCSVDTQASATAASQQDSTPFGNHNHERTYYNNWHCIYTW